MRAGRPDGRISRPRDEVSGFQTRQGNYELMGATYIDSIGVNFTLVSVGATSCELLLFYRKADEPYAILPFPDEYRIGNVYSMLVYGLNIEEFEYAYRVDGPNDPARGLLFDKTKYLLDPYARAVTGQSVWGEKEKHSNHYKARVVRNDYDWSGAVQPETPMEDLVIYEMHVRGFTKDPSSGVENPGTFQAIIEKIPYLKDLGVNAVELMPIFEFDELRDDRTYAGKPLIDYWGYNTVCFFAPNTSYNAKKEFNHEGNQLRDAIKILNQNGIEVFLDVVFNHTAEGNEDGPFFSFKGLDNNIYYMLTPEGKYQNFSGCGNTLNCNHPIVQRMIIECLRYWVVNYRVDGFRFDLATILGRNEDGSSMEQPPLLQSLAYDPVLANVKLIAEAWDAGGLYQVGKFPSYHRWSEWNGQYRDTVRAFLKGDEGKANEAAKRITGSLDLYPPEQRGNNASINFLTCHDGFTLYDLYSYNEKHNMRNGWENTDGENNNLSWNCGVEGETTDEAVLFLRRKLIKNACAVLMLSRGVPMFLSGDEFCNTQYGNNNGYCQDNYISWLDWTRKEKYQDIYEFFRFMIHFRKEHSVIVRDAEEKHPVFPCIMSHVSEKEHEIVVIYSSKNDMVMLAVNSYWENLSVQMPKLVDDKIWRLIVDTNEKESIRTEKPIILESEMVIAPRSVRVLVADWRSA